MSVQLTEAKIATPELQVIPHLGEQLENLEIDLFTLRRLSTSQRIPFGGAIISAGIDNPEQSKHYFGLYCGAIKTIKIYPENVIKWIDELPRISNQWRSEYWANSAISRQLSKTIVHESLHHKARLLRQRYILAKQEGAIYADDFSALKPFSLEREYWQNDLEQVVTKEEREVRRRTDLLMELCPWLGQLVTCQLRTL